MTASRLWILACLLSILPLARVGAQHTCDSSLLENASRAYELGLFVRTFDVLTPCMPDRFSANTHRVAAYRLMAVSYIAMDSLEHARAWVKRLLDIDARYRPDPQYDPPLFTTYVRDMKPGWYTWLWKGGSWYHWAGRSFIVAGTISLPLLLKRDAEPELPGPPVFPPR